MSRNVVVFRNCEPTDAELFAGIVSRDERAFEVFYDRFSGLVYAVCVRVLRHESDAKEVLSEVFQEIWEKAAMFDPERGNARNYLVTLARFRALDRLRSLSAKAINPARMSSLWMRHEYERSPTHSPDASLMIREDIDAMREAVATLNPDQRRMLEMAYFDGMSHTQISTATDIPLGTVKSSIRRGLDALRARLIPTSQAES